MKAFMVLGLLINLWLILGFFECPETRMKDTILPLVIVNTLLFVIVKVWS